MKRINLLFLIFLLPLVVAFNGCDVSPVKYKLQFIVDDAVYYTIDTAGNEAISLPTNPTKTDFEFDGWYWDNNVWHDAFTVNSLLNQPLSSDMRVYAKWRTIEDAQGTQANFTNFVKVDDSTYSTKVNNDVEILNFSNIVQINSSSTWTLNTDIYAQNSIPSKIATLQIGDNTYYILVTAQSGDVKLYTMNIRRLPIYDVTYSNSLGTTYKTIQVQEESYVNGIALDNIRGYTFDSWQYDFTHAIMQNTNIVALFNPNQYKIIYHSNFGDDETLEQDVLYDQTINFKPNNAFTRNGYSLIKWNSDVEINEMQVSFSPNARYKYNLIENLEVYAEWQAINYSIRYYLYNSVNNYISSVTNPNNIGQYTIETETLELLSPTSNGFTFLGWFTDNTYENKIEVIETGSTGHLNLYAKWEVTRYSITYHLNDGINSENNPTEYTYFTNTIILQNPLKVGYDFIGWCRDESFNNITTEIIKGSCENIDLYAKWKVIDYVITYFISDSVENSNNPTTYNIETETIVLQTPTLLGYDFIGFYSEDIFKNKITVIETGSFGDIELYAKWELHSYTITYHLNDGINNIDNLLMYTILTETFTLGNPIKDGYAFVNWYIEANFENVIFQILKGSVGDINVYAKWSAVVYTITYYLDDGTNNGNNVDTYTMESEDIILYDASKTGYAFIGWYSDNKYNNRIGTISQGTYGNIFLYAKFDLITYSITYHLDSGINNENNPNSYTIEDETIILENITRDGYVFAGWYSEENFENIIMQIDKGSHKNYDIYAKWAIASTGFTFDGSSITGYNGSDTDIVLPEYHNGEKITKIAEKAFYDNTIITSVIISQYITSIGDNAFRDVFGNGNLKSIVIPSSVTYIGEWGFAGCNGLTSVTIPSNVNNIGDAAFHSCYALAEVYNLSTLSIVAGSISYGYIGYYAKVIHTSADEPSRIVTENNVTYYACNNEKIAIGLMDRTLASITLSNDCTSVNQYAFYNCYNDFTSITIPSSVTSIGWSAFSLCKNLKNVIFENNSKLIKIDVLAFSNCTSLTSITIPSSVTSIGNYAFRNCTSLESVIFENPDGWGVDGVSLPSSDLSNPNTAAAYLTTYSDSGWTKN